MGERGNHGGVVEAVGERGEANLDAAFRAEACEFRAQVSVGAHAAADEEGLRCDPCLGEPFMGAVEDVRDLGHGRELEAGAEVGDSLLREWFRWARRGAVGYRRDAADRVEQRGLHSAEAEVERPSVGIGRIGGIRGQCAESMGR